MRNEEEITTPDATEASVLNDTPIEETTMTTSDVCNCGRNPEETKPVAQESKFQEMLFKMMTISRYFTIRTTTPFIVMTIKYLQVFRLLFLL